MPGHVGWLLYEYPAMFSLGISQCLPRGTLAESVTHEVKHSCSHRLNYRASGAQKELDGSLQAFL